MSLTLELDSELQAWVRSEAQRNGPDENSFVTKTLDRQRSLANFHPAALPMADTELLHKINIGLPEAIWEEYRALVEKRRDESLTEAEHERLLVLSDKIEIDNAERIRNLIQLAQLRNVSLDALMHSLGIGPRE